MTERSWIVFLSIVLSLWAAMHAYVFWRLGAIPWVAENLSGRMRFLLGLLLAASYPLTRIFDTPRFGTFGWALEVAAADWIGILFLLFAALAVTDLLTLGGVVWPRGAPWLRGWALLAACAFALFGLVQGLRPPALRDYEVRLAELPRERDGLVLVVVSDLHLGSLLDEKWLAPIVERVAALQPQLIVVAGDVIDGDVAKVEPMLPLLQKLRAPLGVWAVTGNHEFYAGLDRSVRLFRAAGFAVLQDRAVRVAPGLVIAGVDDLTTRGQFGAKDDGIEKALTNRPPGATILLSHSPLQAERAAAAGAGLMLSGHTHDGQIWPFNYLVRLRYGLLGGRYEVGGMPVIVGRGTGTWGPRMRLWRRSELLRITLRAGPTPTR